jgi:sugar diacid utilization regulator
MRHDAATELRDESATCVAGSLSYKRIVDSARELSHAAGSQAEVQDLLFEFAEITRRLFGVSRCSVFLVGGNVDEFTGQAASVSGSRVLEVQHLICGTECDRFTQQIVRERAPVLIADARTDPRPVRSAMRAWGVRAMLGIPLIVRGEVAGLLFVDDAGTARTFSPAACEKAVTYAELVAPMIDQALQLANARAQSSRLTQQMKVIRARAALEDKALRLTLEATSIQEVCEVVAGVLQRPCYAYDASRRLRGVARPDGPSSTILAQDVPQDVAAAAIASVSAGPRIVGPFNLEGPASRYLVVPVRWHGHDGGHLLVGETRRTFSAVDEGIVRRVAGFLGIMNAVRRHSLAVRIDAQRSLVRDLVGGNGTDQELRQRAANHRIDPDGRYAVVLLRHRDPALTPLSHDLVLEVLGELAPNTMHLAAPDLHGCVAVLMPCERRMHRGETASEVRSLIECLVQRLHGLSAETVAAISSPAEIPRSCPSAYGEARQLLRSLVAISTAGQRAVISSEEVGVGLLLSGLDHEEAQRFAEQTLGPLLDEEDLKGEFLRTLALYFDHGRNVRKTAEALVVHENTIRYRLGRVRVITGQDFTCSPDDQLRVQLAVLILRLQGHVLAPPAQQAYGALVAA